MADLEEPETALCIIPPRYMWPQIDRVRSCHDKDFPKWPPHIKLIYPFAPCHKLPVRMAKVTKAVRDLGPMRVRLTTSDFYRENECRQAIFLHVDDTEHGEETNGGKFPLDRICEAALEAAENLERSAWYRSMTVGHALMSESADVPQSLMLRAGLLTGIEWDVEELHVLVRDGLASNLPPEESHMMHWATISLRDGRLRLHQRRGTFLGRRVLINEAMGGPLEYPGVPRFYDDHSSQTSNVFSSFFYNGVEWSQSMPELSQQRTLSAAQRTFTVASINVLDQASDLSRLVRSILHTNAEADALVLQGTKDLLLSQLLHDKRVQEKYAFCTHQPIDQKDGNERASQYMMLVLSRYAFDWEKIPLPLFRVEPDGLTEHGRSHAVHDGTSDGVLAVDTFVRSSAVEIRSRMHNRALLLEFRTREDFTDPLKRPAPLALAAFRLTPSQFDPSYVARVREIDAIKQYIFSGSPVILAGAFHMPTSTLTIQASDLQRHALQFEQLLLSSGFIDAWMTAKLSGGAEAGGDLDCPRVYGEQDCADHTTCCGTITDGLGHGKLERRLQRLDRIMIKPHSLLMIQSFNKFGQWDTADSSDTSEPLGCDSLDIQLPTSAIRNTLRKVREAGVKDRFHWGIRSVVKLEHEKSQLNNVCVANDSAPSVASHLDHGLSSHLEGHERVLEALQDAHGIPSLRERQVREEAFKILKNVLFESALTCTSPDSGKQGIDLVILPVGSYGLGVWTSSSDLDCLCIGSFSRSTFNDLSAQRIHQAAHRGIRLIRKTETYIGQVLELDLRVFGEHLKINVTYARTAWPLPSFDPTEYPASDTISNLKAYRDLDYVQRSVPDIASFRLAHRFIKKWAESRGIYSAKFGYLSGIQITILLTRVHKHLVTKVASPTVPKILFTFFKEYASFDWKKDAVFDEYFHKNLDYLKTPREPLAILSYFPPRLNTSQAATVSSVRIVASEFRRAENILDQEDSKWADLLRVLVPGRPTSGSLAADEFLRCHCNYIQVSSQYWGGSTTRGRGFVSWVESRCVSLLADLEQRLSNDHFRIWPTRWTKQHNSEDWGEYQGFFLIGLDWMEERTKQQAAAKRDILESILKRFERQIRGDERHYDAKSMIFGAEFLRSGTGLNQTIHSPDSSPKSSNAGPFTDFQIDGRNWDAYIRMDEDPEDEGEEHELEPATTAQGEWHASSKNRKKPATNQPRSVIVTKPEGAGKFRTAADVLNRLRWDPLYDHNEFVVGYEDRFLGAMERGLDMWKTEQTHEEFIPQHRILYFKRLSDGVVVWERRTRTDMVFGSG